MRLTLAEIADELGAEAVGATDLRPLRPRQPDEAGPDDLALAMEPAFQAKLEEGSARMALVGAGTDWRALGLEAAIVASRPRYAMAALSRLFDDRRRITGIHPTAIVGPGAEIGADVGIGPYAVIEAGARIGARSQISAQVHIGADAVIGEDALIAPGCRIGARVRIGDRFIGQMNAVIGGDGFSFVTARPSAVEDYMREGTIAASMKADRHERINSLGAVIIGDDVEVGANSVIDKGTVSDTRIGNGVKIDALVMVAHNVEIGETALLCGQAGIAGSSRIGARAVLAGKVGVVDHISVGDDSIVLSGSVVTTRLPGKGVFMGYPAVKQDVFVRMYKAMRRLPAQAAKLAGGQKQVSKPDDNG